jgi:hypothetical protein
MTWIKKNPTHESFHFHHLALGEVGKAFCSFSWKNAFFFPSRMNGSQGSNSEPRDFANKNCKMLFYIYTLHISFYYSSLEECTATQKLKIQPPTHEKGTKYNDAFTLFIHIKTKNQIH